MWLGRVEGVRGLTRPRCNVCAGRYGLQVQPPFSPVQAFAVALSSLIL
eukprot:COSAG01_NODE_1941_length_8843_cov_33.836802_8_plen_48_part_00